ncbi:hypothetical protein [Streptomyces griseocarneus]|uniref:hypothetical protein n=1 Tax=Streptomyces griseocarneus TaxID=51201 RepID=UPI00167DAF7D|nr:hypothetical protein [Streptomyces griseocarneus]MBZ6477892.1 hypothetical protein [Streptomyces griseocarneus]GHG54383.1 hypothetical protein GCM10018779_17310 [Streptomyces griseocarneus]
MLFVRSRTRTLTFLSAGAAVALLVTAAWWARWPHPGHEPRGAGAPRGAPTAQVQRLLHDAEQLLLRSCMRRAGFDYHPVPSEASPTGDRSFPYESVLYVLDDPVRAKADGYGRDARQHLRELARHDPNRRYFLSLPPRRRAQALVTANGPSPDGVRATLPTGGVVQRSDRGCVSTAQRRLYGDLRAWFQHSNTVRTLDSLRRARVMADPRYTDGLTAWAHCMRRAGHPYTSPDRTRAAALSTTDPMPREQETALALAEARCARRSGLAGLARRLDEHYGTALRRQYRRDIDLKVRLEAQALPRARAVIDALGER